MAHILLVEDEQLIQDMYHLALKRKGHVVDIADDGEKALAKLMTANPSYDLVLLDVMLPKLDGLSILRKVKQPTSPSVNIPVFLLTNLALDDVMNEARSLGAIKCIVKSSTLPEQIIAEIDEFFTAPQVPTPNPVNPAAAVAPAPPSPEPVTSPLSANPEPLASIAPATQRMPTDPPVPATASDFRSSIPPIDPA